MKRLIIIMISAFLMVFCADNLEPLEQSGQTNQPEQSEETDTSGDSENPEGSEDTENPEQPEEPEQPEQPEQPVEPESKEQMVISASITESDIPMSWNTSGENFSVFQGQKNSLGTFSIVEGSLSADAKTADFSGTKIDSSIPTKVLHAMYPPVSTGDALNHLVSVTGQKGVLDKDYTYMYAKFEYKGEEEKTTFSFKHITTVLKLTMNFPVSGVAEKITLSAQELRQQSNYSTTNGYIGSTGIQRGNIVLDGTYELSGGNQTTVYIYLLPNDTQSNTLTFSNGLKIIADIGGKSYSATLQALAPMQSGVMYSQEVTMQEYIQVKPYEIKDRKLYVNGEEFFVKGVCYNGSNILRGDNYDALAAANGVNVVRTYAIPDLSGDGSTPKGTARIAALNNLGLYVDFGFTLYVASGVNYTDPAYYKSKLDNIKEFVGKYMYCPNIIMWNLGNEFEIGSTPGSARMVACWKLINEAAKYIHDNDPYGRPVTTTLAGYWKEMFNDCIINCPNVDIISVNNYEPCVEHMHRDLQNNQVWLNSGKPYMITEYGPTATWNYSCHPGVARTSWGKVIEGSSAEKAAGFKRIHENYIEAHKDEGCIGGFAFLWGWQSHGEVPTYYAMIDDFENYSLEQIDAMAEAFGVTIKNKAPSIASYKDLKINGMTADKNLVVSSGADLAAVVTAMSSNGVTLTYDWHIIKDEYMNNGGNGFAGSGLLVSSTKDSGNSVTLKAPSNAGMYRILVYARDDRNKKAALATFPFKVE